MPSVDEPQLLRAATYLPVADLERAMSYYQEALGFRRDYVGGEPPMFAILSRDGLPLMLRVVDDPGRITPNDRQGGTWDLFFWVRDDRALHDELVRRGADVVYQPIYQAHYHMEEFAVRDPDGHVVGFGQSMTEAIGGP